MRKEPSAPQRPSRLYVLAGFLFAVLACYVGVLYNAQVVHYADYLEQSQRSITKSEKVTASRGILTDREGKVLVSNRQIYSLSFDSSLLSKDDDMNAAILRLVALCQEEGLPWTDTLPLTDHAPFAYTLDASSRTTKAGFIRFLQSSMELLSTSVTTDEVTEELLNSSGLPAEALFARMRLKFGIPEDWTDTQARKVLGVRYELALRAESAESYLMVKDISSELISILNDGAYLGARVLSSSARRIETDVASHILGVTGAISDYTQELKDAGYAMNDSIGLFGAESAFESYLRGTNGRRVVSFNDQGKVTGETYSVEPVPGATVSLTIDEDFQRSVENALASVIEGLTAKDGVTRGGAAAVIQVGTGEVLALASYPDYDLSRYFQDYAELSADTEGRPLLNRATNGIYPPGSTLKPITAFAALDSGAVTPRDTFNDTGYWKYPSATWAGGLNCWNRSGHGKVNVTSAITNSCNYFFAEVGYRMGMDTLRDYYAAFGLGSKTGIEIGDAAGSLPTQAEGQDLAPWAAFGQANQLYSPLQLANALATLVSGGQHCPAHLLKEVRSADGSEVLALGDSTPLNTIDIQPEYLDAIKKGMLGYTTGSLAGYFKDCVVTAGAKTGTAQMGGEAENNGIFVCFGPYEDPEIAVAIVVEKAGAGANITPAAVQILNAWFSAPEIDTPIQGENQLVP